MSSPSSQNPQYNVNNMLVSNNAGTPRLRQWQLLLQLLKALVSDMAYLWGIVFGNVTFTVQDATPLTGTTVISNGANILAINPAGPLAALTVRLPLSPVNGQPFSINSTQNITALTLTGGTVQFYTTSFMLNAGVMKLVYNSSQSQWILN